MNMSEQPINKSSNTSSNTSTLLAIGGVVLIVLSLCTACMSLSIYFNPAEGNEPYEATWLFCFIFLALPMMAAGIGSAIYALRRRREEKEQTLQNLVLEIALQYDGSVRATELALQSPLSLDGAQDYLEDLASRGICRMEMDEHGTTYFVFARR